MKRICSSGRKLFPFFEQNPFQKELGDQKSKQEFTSYLSLEKWWEIFILFFPLKNPNDICSAKAEISFDIGHMKTSILLTMHSLS